MNFETEALQRQSQQSGSIRAYAGFVLEHGRAKFNFNPTEKASYFVKLATPGGERVVWGKDLERVMRSKEYGVGDAIRLEFKGSEPVTVDAVRRDENGNVVGVERVNTIRNTWDAQKIDPSVLNQEHQRIVHDNAPNNAIPFQGATAFGAPVNSMRVAPSVMPNVGPNALMGSNGLRGLSGLLSRGGGALNKILLDHGLERLESELRSEIEATSMQLAGLHNSAVARLANDGNGEAPTAEELAESLNISENDEQIEQLAKRIERMHTLSNDIAQKGHQQGLTEDEIQRRTVEPLNSFRAANESTLKGLDHGGVTLYQQLSLAIESIVRMLADLFSKMATALGVGQGGNQQQSMSPRN